VGKTGSERETREIDDENGRDTPTPTERERERERERKRKREREGERKSEIILRQKERARE
jgi:hypothetical protein